MKWTKDKEDHLKTYYNSTVHVDPAQLVDSAHIDGYNPIRTVINKLYELGLRKHRKYETQ